MTEPLFRAKDVCELLQCSRTTLWRMTRGGHLPLPTRIGRSNYWRRADIEAFIATKIAATPPKPSRKLSKREQAAQIAALAHAPRRKRRDPSAVIVDSDAVMVDLRLAGAVKRRRVDTPQITDNYHATALSELDRERVTEGSGASLRWRL